MIKANSKCIVTYIDFSAAFDTVSHQFMDITLAKAGSSRKSHTIFRVIYEAAAGIARVNDTDDNYVYSSTFNVGRGVIQGDIISPMLFILALTRWCNSTTRYVAKVSNAAVFRVWMS